MSLVDTLQPDKPSGHSTLLMLAHPTDRLFFLASGIWRVQTGKAHQSIGRVLALGPLGTGLPAD
jgi:hypothetical protein